jgi:transcription antitermination factor NusA-like protein
MTKLVRFDAGDGTTIFVEVEEVASEDIEPVAKTPGELAAMARQTLSSSLDEIAPMVRTMKNRVNAMTDPGDQVEVKFGVKLSGEIGAVIGKVGGEVNYEITLKWSHQ